MNVLFALRVKLTSKMSDICCESSWKLNTVGSKRLRAFIRNVTKR